MDSKRDEKPFNPPKPADPPKVAERVPTHGERSVTDVKSSGRYRLRAQHLFAGDRLLEPGTEVGTDTEYPWPDRPSPLMEGVDDAGKEAVMKLHKELYNRQPPWDLLDNPEYAIHEERRKEQENETDSDPVSHAQAMERGKDWEGPVPQPPQATVTGGSRVAGVSMPSTQVEKPNEEQYPKG